MSQPLLSLSLVVGATDSGAGGRVFGIGTGRVVALLADLPADRIPDLVQVSQRRAEDGLGITPDLQHVLAVVYRAAGRTGLADKVAEGGQAMFAQGRHDFGALA